MDRSHIDKLKADADPRRIADALGLRGRGARFFCPGCQAAGEGAHKTPDLAVSKAGFLCFKCGRKGDLVELVKVAGQMDFPAAIRWLEREICPVVAAEKPRSYGSTRPKKMQPGAFSKAASQPRGAENGKSADPAPFEAFLAGCDPVEGKALKWLTKDRGIAPEVIGKLGLRFCGRGYADIMRDLEGRFEVETLLSAGLLKRSKTGRLVPAFWHYHAKKTGFLVIPYLLDGRPVYLKARPACGKAEAEERGVIRFMNTAAAVTCLYNADALTAGPAGRVVVCEGESDTWTALSHGLAAVGSPGARQFKPAWVPLFEAFRDSAGRSTVHLVMDADAAGAEGAGIIADLFLKAGLPIPLRVIVPAGKDLSDFAKLAPRDFRDIVAAWPEAVRQAFEERAAIREHEAGLSQAEAERKAFEELKPRSAISRGQ